MTSTNRLPWIAAATAVVVAVIAMFVVGWLLDPGGERAGSAGSPDASDDAPAGATIESPSQAPPDQAGTQSSGSGQDGTGGSGNSGGDRGPRIETFRVAQEPTCPGGTTQFPIEGTPVTLEWQVSGVQQVTLSIDGSGVYDTYPAEGDATISFPCSGDEGDTQEHTYVLTAVGDGVTRTGTLVATATVNEVTDVP